MAKRFRSDVSEDDKKVKVNKQGLQHLRQIFGFIRPYRGYFAGGLLFLLFSSLMSMVFPFITGKLVDSVGENTEGLFANRNQIALFMIGILVLQGLFSYSRIWLFAKMVEQALRDIRLALYQKMMSLGIPFFEQSRVGELNSRITNDITQLQSTFSTTLAELLRQIAILIVGIGIIAFRSPQLTLVMLLSFPVLIVAAIFFGKFIRKLSKQVQDDLAQANTVVEETLQAVQVVKSFTNERYEVGRYSTALERVVRNALSAARYRGLFFASFIIFSLFGGIVLVLWYGLGLVAEGTMTIGDLVSFIIYTMFIGGAVGGMGDLYGQLQKSIGASERVLDILNTPGELDLTQPEVPVPALRGHVTYEHVRFAYPTRPDVTVLKDLSLEVLPGQKIALVGHSGAGKSTIVQLLMRFHQVEGGRICIDDQPVHDMDLTALRHHIGIVPQEVMLFGGTIRENIAYGKPGATEQEVIEAARKANAWSFISAFPEGLSTVVGERGVKLSGGQRQRIAIARAILKNPTILVLDEATSSLDAESERVVQEALDVLMENRTTIIIAHRLATIRKVDRIYVIGDGQVVEAGTHAELAHLEEGVYQHLLRLQFEPQQVG
ncbi:ABC-type multidrug transport system, ATPase and permease component [Catalinimonas alkaloidigena]|uniref:ABC-type multidrug transport system, ATPase and permease component n=1 Tax=Catalinimonas alkaloidigena TaxID=1075417 RepID=A0A1G9E6G9_9BACT|nr:ABC transporter transmembrane domain-containing protein [Catalinimonas alkaloidigena]SDK71678.1 ABC-type multidrug transport system, ATPase and permease component [Catalinimonas alkaloidigena]